MAHALLNERTPSVSERWVVSTEDGRVVWIVGERVGILQENAIAMCSSLYFTRRSIPQINRNLRIRFEVWFVEILNSSVTVCDANRCTPETVQAIHFGRVVPPVAIDYRSGFQFLLLSVSKLSVFSTTSAWRTAATAKAVRKFQFRL